MKTYVRDDRIYLYSDYIFDNYLWTDDHPQPASDLVLSHCAEAVIELYVTEAGESWISVIKTRWSTPHKIYERRELPRILKLIQKQMEE